ncbi:DUF72 domain-containing protein [Pseudoxanthomonas dokdonensis]|uniref:DUF72 domain-containing protein n=1 Tax=Pseudoxanthomonas dokdonensis TaxID=344882 RepID=UPI0026B543AB
MPGRYHALFNDGDSMLARYATRFDVVEINSSFYRPHRHATYARWAASVPAGFAFSAKLPRTISHELGLRGCADVLQRFLDQVDGLGDKLGGLLLQLPPSLALDMRVAAGFFRVLRNRSAADLVCEPRHPSWFSDAAAAFLQRHAVSRVIADPPRVTGAVAPLAGTAWPYWRWHGYPRVYYSDYSEAALQQLAQAARASASAAGRAPWVIFDNTAHGFAIANAARLQQLLLQQPASHRPQRHHA